MASLLALIAEAVAIRLDPTKVDLRAVIVLLSALAVEAVAIR
jgi:hypothetical protein